MYLRDLAMETLKSPKAIADLDRAQRFRVSSCPWLVGKIIRWSQGGVTVKFSVPNTPWDEDHKPLEKDEPAAHVGNYTGVLCVSAFTEVTKL